MYTNGRNTGAVFMAAIMMAWGIPKPSLAQVEFFGARGIRTSERTGRFELIDLDGDDQLDAVVLLPLSGKIAIYKGFSDGTFSLVSEQEIGGNSFSMIAADYNGDGDTDIAARLWDENSIVILLSNGDGNLTESDRILIDGLPGIGLAAGDIDDDGDVDIVVSKSQDPAVVVLTNSGNGQFEITGQIETPYNAGDIALGDLDNDGDLDLAIQTGSSVGEVTTFFNDGSGSFGSPIILPFERNVSTISLIDFDMDGDLDLMTFSSRAAQIIISLNNGSGVFEIVHKIQLGRYGRGSPVLGDIDSDGDIDIIAPFIYSLGILSNLGNGDFSEPSMILAGLSERNNASINKLADLNGDGYLDIVSLSGKSHRLSTLLNLGDGTFPSLQLIDPPEFPSAATWGDLDRDDLPDLIAYDLPTEKLIIRFGRGSGFLETPVELPFDTEIAQIVAADLNNDQLIDLCISRVRDGFTVMLNQGTRVFSKPVHYLAGRTVGPIIVEDFDGDGSRDLVFGQRETITLMRNNGEGAFLEERNFEKNAGPVTLVAADFNGDGSLDLAHINQSSDSFSLILNDGLAEFSKPVRINVQGYIRALAAGNLNEDGFADLIVLGGEQHDILQVLFNMGDLTFEVVAILQATFELVNIVLSDIDDDGDLDIVYLNEHLNDVSIYVNVGLGEYAGPLLYAVRADRTRLMVVDTDGDHDKDIMLLPTRFGKIDVLRNLAADDDGDGIPNELDPDDDNDGALDEVDECPGISATTPNGCPGGCFDRDTDGFCDVDDNCPEDFNPSQTDSDGDGAGNQCDACPNDAEKTAEGFCGCGIADVDTDNDGVLNCVDNCQNTPVETTVDQNGCPLEPTPPQPVPGLDDDGDGVPNENDDCSNTEPSSEVNNAGCPSEPPSEQPLPDSDGDGITDDLDLCVDTADGATVDSVGCATVDTPGDTTNDLASILRALCGSVGIIGWTAMLAGLAALKASRRSMLR